MDNIVELQAKLEAIDNLCQALQPFVSPRMRGQLGKFHQMLKPLCQLQEMMEMMELFQAMQEGNGMSMEDMEEI